MPRTMNDPHVNALVFRIEHGPAVSYSDDAPAIDHDEPGFRVTLKDPDCRVPETGPGGVRRARSAAVDGWRAGEDSNPRPSDPKKDGHLWPPH